MDNWHLFRSIWEIDIKEFAGKYKKIGIELGDFEDAMGKYFDVSNQVLMQDTITTISFLTLECSKLKYEVLEYVGQWKHCYKEILCFTADQKIKSLYKYLDENVEKLSQKPYNIQLLEDAIRLHEKCTAELLDKEENIEEITKYFNALGKF